MSDESLCSISVQTIIVNQTNLLLEEQQKPLGFIQVRKKAFPIQFIIPTLLSNVEKLASTMETDGKMNFYRMVYLTFEIVPRAVKYKFDQLIPFGDLKQKLREKQEALQKLKNKGVFTPDQWKILYPKKGIVKSTDFDTTLMLLLLRTIGVISRPVNGWYTFPNKTDCSASADLIRILLIRNRVAYCTGSCISKRDFNGIWEELTKAIIRIGGLNSTDEIKAISKIPLDQLIEKHYKEFEELKSKDTIQKNTLVRVVS
ncbi:hypothetical protein KUTeg_006214 [Tegillarca granosa]|uniref:DZIP3-like HEPN domain-containing protein n=1 Tax=Tegillarca granosa TaxID=220873 RepID=A0ABQ9FKJ7_TEGGR|nr:hypothetical protein KUTeg_006214 [Tegillarca granosa]